MFTRGTLGFDTLPYKNPLWSQSQPSLWIHGWTCGQMAQSGHLTIWYISYAYRNLTENITKYNKINKQQAEAPSICQPCPKNLESELLKWGSTASTASTGARAVFVDFPVSMSCLAMTFCSSTLCLSLGTDMPWDAWNSHKAFRNSSGNHIKHIKSSVKLQHPSTIINIWVCLKMLG